jgi:hypothetical protein
MVSLCELIRRSDHGSCPESTRLGPELSSEPSCQQCGTPLVRAAGMRRVVVAADKDDWRDAWVAEGISALLSCQVLNERTAPSVSLWKPEDDAENTAGNLEAAGSVAVVKYTPPGYRRPRRPRNASHQPRAGSPAVKYRR